jgi:hypothetical protein
LSAATASCAAPGRGGRLPERAESEDTYTVQLTASYLLSTVRAQVLLLRRVSKDIAPPPWRRPPPAQDSCADLLRLQLACENIRIALADIIFNEKLLKDARAKHEAGAGSSSRGADF